MKTKKEITNIAGSVKERLQNYSRKNSLEFNSVLLQFIQERFLFRISKSHYAHNFVLKGALLFLAHEISRFRPTKDIDLLGSALPNEVEKLKEIFREISLISFNDGLIFESDSIKSEEIIEHGEYHGIRLHVVARLGTAKQQMQIDIGFGDVIFPKPEEIDYPTLLDFEAPHLLVYSLESAIAEKFEAAVSLGIATSRMKDFYDLHYFASKKVINLNTLHTALRETFRNRQTSIEKRYSLFDDKFKNDKNLQVLWKTFLKKRLIKDENNFSEIVSRIEKFINPAFDEIISPKVWNFEKWEWK